MQYLMKRGWAVVVSALALLGGAIPAAAQVPAPVPNAGVTLMVPAGWKVAPQSSVDQLNKERADPESGYTILAKFDRADGLGIGYPYMTVELSTFDHYSEASWADIKEFMVADDLPPELAAKPMVARLAAATNDQCRLDTAAGRFYAKYEDTPGDSSGRLIREHVAGVVTSKGIVEICLYDKAEENDRYLPDLASLSTSAKIDPGAAFQPGAGVPVEEVSSSGSSSSGFRFGRFGIFGIGGIGGLGCTGLVIRLLIRKWADGD